VGLVGEAVTVPGVTVVAALALLAAASRNSSRKARQPLPLRTRELIAEIPFRVVTTGMDRISNILKSSALSAWLAMSQGARELTGKEKQAIGLPGGSGKTLSRVWRGARQ
jgi:hypothetical protein